MVNSKADLAGKVAMITGGASGIGRALGKEMALRGAEVVLADRQIDLATEVAKEIEAAGGKARAAELDVRSFPDFEALAEDTRARSGPIDYFFNNAGIAIAGEMSTYQPADWDDVIDVNLRGVAHGIQAVYPAMVREGKGHIVNTASMAGLYPTPEGGGYAATKHAVVGLSKSLRVEAKAHGVRVSVLCPGAIRTPILTGGQFGRFDLGVPLDAVMKIWERTRPMPPEVFARKAIDAILRNDPIIILPTWWKALWYLDRLSPSLSMAACTLWLDRTRAELAKAKTAAAGGAEKPR